MNFIEKFILHKGLSAIKALIDPANSEFWTGIIAPIVAFAVGHVPAGLFGIISSDPTALQAQLSTWLLATIPYAVGRLVSKYIKA